jgi:hypothetical protein
MQNLHKKKIISTGGFLGVLSAAFITAGVYAPAVDFSRFNSSVDLQYNLLKICKNVGLISSMWRAIPVGFLVAAVMMLGLSFVKIPAFRVLPCILAISMLVLMLTDVGNIVEWVKGFTEKYFETGTGQGVSAFQVLQSFTYGVYFLLAGIVTGVISIFVK